MKKTMFKKSPVLLMCASLLGLTACGGDGNGGNGGSDSVNRGSFTGMAITGLAYSTETQAGNTDTNGEFNYQDGETITFSLAGYTLGSSPAAAKLDVFSLAGASQPSQRQINQYMSGELNKVSDAPVNKIFNTVLLLQTLDEDNDPSNGIHITSATNAALTDTPHALDFSASRYPVHANLKRVLKQASLAKGPSSNLNVVRQLVSSGVIATPLYRLSRYDTYSGADGILNSIVEFSYDTQGNMIKQTFDYAADGSIDNISEYSFDSQGNNTQIIRGANGSGIGGAIYRYSYDAQGNQTQQTLDRGADGALESIYTYSFDAQGNQTSYETDNDADGNADTRYVSIFDALGNRTRYELDTNADNSTDNIYHHSYDAKGNLTQTNYDQDADGQTDSINNYLYNDKGDRLRTENDTDADGVANSIHQYHYDVVGNRTQQLTDTDGDGDSDRNYSYGFDVQGNKISQTTDNDADGAAEVTYHSSYDEQNNNIGHERRNNDDLTYRSSMVYDEAGNLVSESVDTDGDGDIDKIISYTFEVTATFSYGQAEASER